MSTHPRKKTTDTPRPDPVDVARLHAAGVSRNGVARALEVSTRQVDNVARELGLSWSAERVREAAAVRRTTARVERLVLAAAFRRLATRGVREALKAEEAGDARRWTLTAAVAVEKDLAIWAETPSAAADGEQSPADAAAQQLVKAFDRALSVHSVEELAAELDAEDQWIDPPEAAPP